MYIKRPLCAVSVAFCVLAYLFTIIFPLKPCINADYYENKEVICTGIIQQKDIKNGILRLYLKNAQISVNDKSVDRDSQRDYATSSGLVGEINTDDYDLSTLKLGSVVQLTGKFISYDKPQNEGEFDMNKYYLIRGYEGRIKKCNITAISKKYLKYRELLWGIRLQSEKIYDRYMNEEDSGIMKALVLGDKTDLDENVKDLYQAAGISHILSLSGVVIPILGN